MRVDVHAHILPRRWPDLAERYGDPRWPTLEHLDPCSARIMVGGELFRAVTSQLYDVERRLADMDETGVARQVLSTVPVMFSYWAQPRRTLELSRHLNEHLAETLAAHPDRFSGFGTVPLNDPELAVGELERCMLELGMAGVQIGTNIAGVELDDPRLLPFFTRASELGAVVFVHPWQVIGAQRMRSYYFLYTIAMPSETAFAVGALLFGGVLERLPQLQLLFAHGGGSAAYVIGRMQRGWEVWEPAREHLRRPPIEALACCHFDSVTWDAASLELLVRRVGAERVLLGSDYPFVMGEERPGTIVQSAELAEEQKQAILGGNASRLLRLNRDAIEGAS
ncbi:MAG: amidohydrolase family protein [Solirubrobacteraceae bacterium]